jgi:uncharacterized protein
MAAPSRARATEQRRVTSLEVLCAVLVLALLAQGPLVRVFDIPAVRTGATVFVAVCVQAMPFLVLGVLVSGLIAAFVSPLALRRCCRARPQLRYRSPDWPGWRSRDASARRCRCAGA